MLLGVDIDWEYPGLVIIQTFPPLFSPLALTFPFLSEEDQIFFALIIIVVKLTLLLKPAKAAMGRIINKLQTRRKRGKSTRTPSYSPKSAPFWAMGSSSQQQCQACGETCWHSLTALCRKSALRWISSMS